MKSVAIGALFLLIGLVPGCGTDLVSYGRVQFEDGEPVRSGTIEFRNIDSRDQFAGKINREGYFQLTSVEGEPGVPAGDYEIIVLQRVITEDLASHEHTHGRTVPRKFADYFTSGLTMNVEEGRTELLWVALPDAE